jgi:hypothetical protein
VRRGTPYAQPRLGNYHEEAGGAVNEQFILSCYLTHSFDRPLGRQRPGAGLLIFRRTASGSQEAEQGRGTRPAVVQRDAATRCEFSALGTGSLEGGRDLPNALRRLLTR